MSVTDGGRILHTGIASRRPTVRQRRNVERRDQTGTFPGCRMPASACDLDHRRRVADGGDTHEGQLVALCRHDHRIRHAAGWIHRADNDGSYTWVSPLGVQYSRPRAP